MGSHQSNYYEPSGLYSMKDVPITMQLRYNYFSYVMLQSQYEIEILAHDIVLPSSGEPPTSSQTVLNVVLAETRCARDSGQKSQLHL